LIEGLQAPRGGTKEIYSDEALGKKVFLTDRSAAIWDHFDRAQSLAYSILTTSLGISTLDANSVSARLSGAREERLRKSSSQSAFLVIEAAYLTRGDRLGLAGRSVLGNFGLALPNGFREEVEEKHQPFFQQAQSFLYFAFPSVSGLILMGDCIVADHPKGYPLYVLTSSASARSSLNYPIPVETEEEFELLTALFRRSDDLQIFRSTFQLFAGSATNIRDNLRAFLFAFTALESFLVTFFKRHKQRLFQHRKDAISPEISKYVEDIEKRREDQGRTDDSLPIAYRFALIASYLQLESIAERADKFDDVVDKRNAIAHGYAYNEATLPTAQVWELLGQLVCSYIKGKSLGDA
jgi:hypothetical protein